MCDLENEKLEVAKLGKGYRIAVAKDFKTEKEAKDYLGKIQGEEDKEKYKIGGLEPTEDSMKKLKNRGSVIEIRMR